MIGFNSPLPLAVGYLRSKYPQGLRRLKQIYRIKFMAVAVLLFKLRKL